MSILCQSNILNHQADCSSLNSSLIFAPFLINFIFNVNNSNACNKDGTDIEFIMVCEFVGFQSRGIDHIECLTFLFQLSFLTLGKVHLICCSCLAPFNCYYVKGIKTLKRLC